MEEKTLTFPLWDSNAWEEKGEDFLKQISEVVKDESAMQAFLSLFVNFGLKQLEKLGFSRDEVIEYLQEGWTWTANKTRSGWRILAQRPREKGKQYRKHIRYDDKEIVDRAVRIYRTIRAAMKFAKELRLASEIILP